MADTKYTPRLRTLYDQNIREKLTKQFGYTNGMQVPALDKVVINMGVGEAVADSKKIRSALADLTAISGQKPVETKSRKSNWECRGGWHARQPSNPAMDSHRQSRGPE